MRRMCCHGNTCHGIDRKVLGCKTHIEHFMKYYITFFYFLQLLFLAYIFNWRVPVRLSNILFRVVGGFPNFVESHYFDLTNGTYIWHDEEPENDVVEKFSENIFSKYLWKCDSLYGDSKSCFSVVSEENCKPDSQYSYNYWNAYNNLTRCVKANVDVLCINASISGNECYNIVGAVHIRKTSTLVELNDGNIGETIIQTLQADNSDSDDNTNRSCYELQDSLSTNNALNTIVSDETGKCLKGNLDVKFGLNSSTMCFFDTVGMNCSSIRHQLLEWWKNVEDSDFCNCGSCEVPYLEYSTSPPSVNSDYCLLPLEAQYLFTYHEGSISGMVNKLIWSDVKTSTLVAVKKKIAFLPLTTSSPLSRFERKRGRFQCPASVGCWKSLFYIFGRLERITWSDQIVLIIVSIMLTALIIQPKPVNKICERKFPFAYFPGNFMNKK